MFLTTDSKLIGLIYGLASGMSRNIDERQRSELSPCFVLIHSEYNYVA
ncbi:hypothetical protein BURPS1710A_2501 [Burkholderia pseudomallei 1710a]|uniref:Uncharacterized protein n=1 Tax=Burkholderia pseudomallei 1710a TaxID=320371 RepID=A0A0E1W075_BURPE|nr:hypothetical protein BURPS1710A_2501 [Burkholderia pseudomallei 1710a]